MNDTEFPEYAIKISKHAAEVRDALPHPLHRVLNEVLDQLSENPDRFPHRSRRLSRGAEVNLYAHPRPRIEVTYEIDRGRKLLYFVHIAVPQLIESEVVFISYSHKDEHWLDKLRPWLSGFEHDGQIRFWSDREIRAGENWREEVGKALKSARAAVLLVSQNFLASRFIAEHELPPLLDSARVRELQILWIAITESDYRHTEIETYEAVNDPRFPLDGQEADAQKEIFKDIYERIKSALSV